MWLLASGRTADVYAIDTGRVLRRYRDGLDATGEAAVMRHVRAHGFPVPAVHRVEGPDLEMDRLDGSTMLAALLAGQLGVDDAATVLADLHRRLHTLPPSGRRTDPGDTVIHLDLHPDSVVMTAGGPVLIDWYNATDGPPDLDVALSALILAQVAVDTAAEPAALARDLLAAFLRRADGMPERMLGHAAARRGADPMMSRTELELLGTAADLVAEHCGDR